MSLADLCRDSEQCQPIKKCEINKKFCNIEVCHNSNSVQILNDFVVELQERRERDLRKQKAAAKLQAQLRNIMPEGGRSVSLQHSPPFHLANKNNNNNNTVDHLQSLSDAIQHKMLAQKIGTCMICHSGFE